MDSDGDGRLVAHDGVWAEHARAMAELVFS
jgi:hypothetical protein